jgi:hypothetical protein
MSTESPERLRAIKDELARVESKDFWEIIDRGRNFEFMPAAQREGMLRFFERFDLTEVAASPSPPRTSAPPERR